MSALWSQSVVDGATVLVSLGSGQWVRGTVVASDQHWLLLDSGSGRMLLGMQHIHALALDGSLPASLSGAKRGLSTSPDQEDETTSGSVTERVSPQQLRQAIDALFEGEDNATLQDLLGITRQQVGHLRKAFTYIRGDCEREQLPAPALAWIEPLQAVARGEV